MNALPPRDLASSSPSGPEPGPSGITPRNLEFEIGEDLKRDWLDDSPFRTAFFNALSLQFPEGERQFIHAVRLYRDEVENPVLRDQVRHFIAQEAMHGREHQAYNAALAARGYDLDRLNRIFKNRMDFLKTRPRAAQLAGTCAAEHITAVMAHHVLTHPGVLEHAPENLRRLWLWHALEETEHKAVAYDVYQERVQNPRLRRIVFFFVIANFWRFTILNTLHMLRHDGQLWRWRTVREACSMFWGKDGLLRHSSPLFWRYLRRDFHPWQHDNERLMQRWQNQFDRLPAGSQVQSAAG